MVKTIVKIDGMMCSMCEAHINDAIRNNLSVKSVKANHSKGEAEIVSESAPDEKVLKKVITDTGYDYIGMKTEPYKRGLFHR